MLGTSQTLDYYMVSELCEGGDVRKLLYTVDELGNILSPRPRLAEQTVMHLLGELFSGLAYMYGNWGFAVGPCITWFSALRHPPTPTHSHTHVTPHTSTPHVTPNTRHPNTRHPSDMCCSIPPCPMLVGC